jgi:hypothetical protein
MNAQIAKQTLQLIVLLCALTSVRTNYFGSHLFRFRAATSFAIPWHVVSGDFSQETTSAGASYRGMWQVKFVHRTPNSHGR